VFVRARAQPLAEMVQAVAEWSKDEERPGGRNISKPKPALQEADDEFCCARVLQGFLPMNHRNSSRLKMSPLVSLNQMIGRHPAISSSLSAAG